MSENFNSTGMSDWAGDLLVVTIKVDKAQFRRVA